MEDSKWVLYDTCAIGLGSNKTRFFSNFFLLIGKEYVCQKIQIGFTRGLAGLSLPPEGVSLVYYTMLCCGGGILG